MTISPSVNVLVDLTGWLQTDRLRRSVGSIALVVTKYRRSPRKTWVTLSTSATNSDPARPTAPSIANTKGGCRRSHTRTDPMTRSTTGAYSRDPSASRLARSAPERAELGFRVVDQAAIGVDHARRPAVGVVGRPPGLAGPGEGDHGTREGVGDALTV